MTQIKKLSVATIFGKISIKDLLAAPETTMPVMRVIGLAMGVKKGDSNYGEWTALLGTFQCTNLQTGEASEAATLFLPEVALIPIQVALSAEGVRGVEFAIDISVRYVENGKPGGVPYEYTWTPLLPPDQNDPITRIKNKLLALQGPAKGETDPVPKDPPPAAGGKKK